MKDDVVSMLLSTVGNDGGEQPTPDNAVEEKESIDVKTEALDHETLDVDGLQFKITEAEDGAMEYETPEGFDDLPEETKTKAVNKLNEGIHTLSKLKKERMEQGNKDKKLEELESNFKRQQDELVALKAKLESPKEQETDPMKYWGVETWAEVAEIQQDDPEAYTNGMSKKIKAETDKHSEEIVTRNKITARALENGITYSDLSAFAKESGISKLDTALDFMLLKKGETKKDGFTAVRRKSPTTPPKNSTNPEQKKPVPESVRLSSIIGGYDK